MQYISASCLWACDFAWVNKPFFDGKSLCSTTAEPWRTRATSFADSLYGTQTRCSMARRIKWDPFAWPPACECQVNRRQKSIVHWLGIRQWATQNDRGVPLGLSQSWQTRKKIWLSLRQLVADGKWTGQSWTHLHTLSHRHIHIL